MFKGKIINGAEATLYCMPCLEEDGRPPTEEELLKEAEEMQRKAYEEGFASGERAGFETGEQKARVLIDEVAKIIEEITLFKEHMVSDLEPQVVDLAIAIARKVIIEEVNSRPEIIVTMVKEALKRLQRTGAITIRINPALYELFSKHKDGIFEIHEDVVFDVNTNVPVSGPLVISETQEVVTDIDSLLSNIIKEMREDVGKDRT